MNCKETQHQLLETTNPRSTAVDKHLRDCVDCQRFAALQDALLGLPRSEPPPHLDRAVKAVASFRLAKLQRQHRHRVRWLVAAAALVCLTGWFAALVLDTREQGNPVARLQPPAAEESVWADGKLEAALMGLQEQVALLETPIVRNKDHNSDLPTLEELDEDLLDFELRFYFERAVLGTVETPTQS
jgi:hypothetical protein